MKNQNTEASLARGATAQEAVRPTAKSFSEGITLVEAGFLNYALTEVIKARTELRDASDSWDLKCASQSRILRAERLLRRVDATYHQSVLTGTDGQL